MLWRYMMTSFHCFVQVNAAVEKKPSSIKKQVAKVTSKYMYILIVPVDGYKMCIHVLVHVHV